jgi:mRNA degradation ribonuclease J1/J2
MVDLVRLWNWMSHLQLDLVGLKPFRHDSRGEVTGVATVPGFHASGHASGSELAEFVKLVRPRVLVAIHSEEPQLWSELLAGTDIRVVVPEDAATIEL